MSTSKKKPESEDPKAKKPDEAQQAPETEAAPEAAPGPSFDEQLKGEREKYLRLAAEYDNYRKRSAKEREAIFADVRADTVLKFLPVYDNLARALELDAPENDPYRKGVDMTMAQLKDVLKNLGVTEIEAVGKTFDPAVHSAVVHIDDEKYGENEIVLELQKGFRLGEKVIRFSMVQVAN